LTLKRIEATDPAAVSRPTKDAATFKGSILKGAMQGFEGHGGERSAIESSIFLQPRHTECPTNKQILQPSAK
jgi:hypothetical protein